MSILFLTGIVVVEGIVGAQQIDDLVEEALDNDNYHFMLSGQYQSNNPIILETSSNEDLTILIHGFETMNVVDDVAVYYIEFIVEATTGELDTFSDVSFDFTSGAFPIKFVKFLNRQLYLVVSEENNTKLDINTFFLDDETMLKGLTIKYQKADEEVVFTTPLSLQKSDLVLKAHIDTHLNNHDQAYPETNTQDIKLLLPLTLDTDGAVVITVLVEAILIGILTIYIYIFRPRQKLGKIKPSEHLKKDIQRITNNKE